MDSITNIIMRLRGDSDDADATLAGFTAKLRAFGGQKATAEADVKVDGEDKLAEIAAAVESLNAARAAPTVGIETKEFFAGMTAVQAALVILENEKAEIKIKADQSIVSEIEAAAASLGAHKITIPVDAKDDATGTFARIAAAATALGAKSVSIKVKAEDSFTLVANRVGSVLSHLNVPLGGFDKLGALVFNVGDSISKLGEKIGGVTVNLGAFGLKLSSTLAIVLALAAAMAGSLVAGFVLLGSAIVGAVAALGLLAAGFAATLGPAVGVAVAAITRLAAVLKVIKELDQSQLTATAKAADGTKAAATAAEERTTALENLKSALQSVGDAERGLEQAKQNASDQIQSATDAQLSATEALGNATENLKRQTVAAYEAMAQAAEDTKDAVLDVQFAQLGIEKSSNAVKKAQLALETFRQQAGLASSEFDKMFQKFQDVDFAGNISGSLTQGTGIDKGSALKLEDLIIALKEAKLNEKKATDTLSDSERNLGKARKTQAEFATKGIKAFQPYVAALQAQGDAARTLNRATQTLNRLEANGVSQAPGVIAAREGLANAEQRLADARRRLKNTKEGGLATDAAKAAADFKKLPKILQALVIQVRAAKTGLKGFASDVSTGIFVGIGTAIGLLPKALNPLKASLKNLGFQMGGAIAAFANVLTEPAVQAGLKTLIDGSAKLAESLGAKAIPNFVRLMINLGNATLPFLVPLADKLANAIGRFADHTANVKKTTDSFRPLVRLLSSITGFFSALGGLVLAFVQDTAGISADFTDSMSKSIKSFTAFIKSPKGHKEIANFFKAVLPLLKQTLKFIANFIIFFGRLLEIVAPALTDILSAINFLFGAFNDLLGILTPVLQLLLRLGVILIGGPAKGVLKLIQLIVRLKAVSEVFNFLKKVAVAAFDKIKSVATTVVHFIEGLFPSDWLRDAFNGLINAAKAVGRFLHNIFNTVIAFIVARFRNLKGFFSTVFNGLTSAARAVRDFLKTAFHDAVGFIEDRFRGLIKFMEDLPGKFFKLGKEIIKKFGKGISSIPGTPLNLFKKGVEKFVNILPGSEPKDSSSPLSGLRKRGKAIFDNLADGFPSGTKVLTQNLHQSLVPAVATISTGTVTPALSAPSAAFSGTAGGTVNHNTFQILAPPGQLPDAEATSQALARKLEAKSGGSPRQ